MSKLKPVIGLWQYLDALGVLDHGSDGDIKAAKQAYRRKYLLEFKQRQRKNKPEFAVNLSKETGEYDTILQSAKHHHKSIPAFLKEATLAYIQKTFIVPNPYQLAQLEQLLSHCLNEIQAIVKKKEIHHWEREQKFEAIEKRILKLEKEISETLRMPIPVEDFVKKAIQKDNELKQNLLVMLTQNDHKNKIPEETKL